VTALLGLAIATLVAYLLGADRTLIRDGLFGFKRGPDRHHAVRLSPWDRRVAVYIILGAIVSAIAMMGRAKLLVGWDMTPLTVPFVLTAWLLLFALYQFAQLHPTELIHPMLMHPGATIQTGLQGAPGSGGAVGLTAVNLANALFCGVSEVFLQDNPWSGVVFAIAILVNSRTCFVFALLGSALGGMTALVLGADGAVHRGDLQRHLVRCHRCRAVTDRHAGVHRPVRAHDRGVPAAHGRLQSTGAGSVTECASAKSLARLRTPESTRTE